MTFDPVQGALIAVVVLDTVIIIAIVMARLAARRDAPAWPPELAGETAQVTPPADAPPAPAGTSILDGVRPWADPSGVADEPAEWRRALTRESARAARYGRPATIMQVELDQDGPAGRAGNEANQAEGLLLGVISTRVRSSDYVARTAPGRFHLILTDMPESEGASVAERIRAEFTEHAPEGPPMLVGWAGTPPLDGLASSLWQAAERVHVDRRRLRGGDDGEGHALSPEGSLDQATAADDRAQGASTQELPEDGGETSIETALVALERMRTVGLVTEEEYRAKRSEILARL